MTILLVDDEPEYRLIMKNVLSGEGWDVLLAENGQEALDRLKEHSVDLVVTDIYMPVMDGIKFHRTVRALPQFESLPFLFVSAYDDQHTLDAIKDPNHEGFVRKTRPVEEILEWVTYLSTPQEQRPKSPPTPLPLKSARMRRGDSSTPIY
ncbi:MAG: response regulator [Bacteroidota bacterium]